LEYLLFIIIERKEEIMKTTALCLSLCVFSALWPFSSLFASDTDPSTREMNLLCWQEFQELVPEKIQTVLLPVGSIEPHGVIPNGTDSLAPEAMARHIAVRLNALIAPTLNYGVTPAMAAYPGAVSIDEKSYLPFVCDILKGLASQKFLNIIILNGHGGNTSLLQAAVKKISPQHRVRMLVVNWWSLADGITKEVFGENGGHAGNNETAYIQYLYPDHIHPQRYSPEMASINPTGNAYYAVPVPSSIGLYEKGQGYPTFDTAQASEYFRKVNDAVFELIRDVIRKWDMADLYKTP
jgi:creatinine amidohydrolase